MIQISTIGSRDTVNLHLPVEDAEELSSSLSDFLCWCAGYRAAGGEPPMGIEDARTLNIALKKGIAQSKEKAR